ncbi:unnamed protein product [Didymodactylos carnosus]|uniref:Lysozyme n=1 Tax=Didymodactylos carnosus TaxID=1234261 RepID=A0A815B981_9BILA|nr:unnamed protein product [Didymodactylos carnosus]CAF1267545.1 unnamed protein product [Didymodactylos carnosus]CAF3704576.1 unnamed protein product [Didymodactylos carnosus]CAF4052143.1 unnamed protein product [Didymodactylos carnosus]
MTGKMIGLICFLTVSITTILATKGIDVSQSVTQAQFECLKNAGYEFVITRVHQSTGKVDPNGARTIKNAKAAGFRYVDGYIFPCFSCGNPAKQVSDTIDNLNSNGAEYGMIWLDIESGANWSSIAQDNIDFIQQMIDELKRLKVNFGIYAQKSQWTHITGNTVVFGDPPLWYPHYDNVESFSGFQAFGGWTKPAIKQYQGDVSECGVGIDRNFY